MSTGTLDALLVAGELDGDRLLSRSATVMFVLFGVLAAVFFIRIL